MVPELETNQTTQCTDFSPKCLQAVSEMATRQTANVQYINVSFNWMLHYSIDYTVIGMKFEQLL